jgi:hypothetical protein|tara:strand:+ start:355 stop:594 length:240 start_codon:yes stop_codon:yes gene_type:complete
MRIIPFISIVFINLLIPDNANQPMNRYKKTSKLGNNLILLIFKTIPKIASDQIILTIAIPKFPYKLIRAIGVYVPAIKR